MAAAQADPHDLMSWGPISADSDTPEGLEKALQEAGDEYFGQNQLSEFDDKAGRQQVKVAAAAARTLAEKGDFSGGFAVHATGHPRQAGGHVPSGITLSIYEVNPPVDENNAEDAEGDVKLEVDDENAENDENSAENGQN